MLLLMKEGVGGDESEVCLDMYIEGMILRSVRI